MPFQQQDIKTLPRREQGTYHAVDAPTHDYEIISTAHPQTNEKPRSPLCQRFRGPPPQTISLVPFAVDSALFSNGPLQESLHHITVRDQELHVSVHGLQEKIQRYW